MKVFLSWSGEKSRRVANVLRDWLPTVLQGVEPWLASMDIEPGSRWRESINDALSASDAAIICVSRSNQHSPWLNFESGALVEVLSLERVIPLMIDGELSELPGPLALRQGLKIEKYQMLRLAETLGQLSPDKLLNVSDRQLDEVMRSLSNALAESSSDRFNVSGAQIGSVGPSASTEVQHPDHTPAIDALTARLDQLVGIVQAISDRVLVDRDPGPPLEAEPEPHADRPTLFIGSSIEGKKIAEAIAVELEYEVECTLWTQGLFMPGSGTLETLVDIAPKFDFGVIVMTADDILIKRGVEHKAPRDNLIFEIGLFTGRLGRGRAFVVHPRDEAIEFPSDFKGTTLIDFQMERADGNLQAAVGPACTRIKRAMGI